MGVLSIFFLLVCSIFFGKYFSQYFFFFDVSSFFYFYESSVYVRNEVLSESLNYMNMFVYVYNLFFYSFQAIFGDNYSFFNLVQFCLVNNINVLYYPVFFSLFGSILCYFVYSEYFSVLYNKWSLYFYNLFSRKFLFDKFQNEHISKFFINTAFNGFSRNLDKGILEYLGPMGIIKVCSWFSEIFNRYLLGNVFTYIRFICLGLLLLVNIFLIVYGFQI